MDYNTKSSYVKCSFSNQKAYFDSLYRSITAETETCATEAENCKKFVDLQRGELDLKEQWIKLRESLLKAFMDDTSSTEDTKKDDQDGKAGMNEMTDMEATIKVRKHCQMWND